MSIPDCGSNPTTRICRRRCKHLHPLRTRSAPRQISPKLVDHPAFIAIGSALIAVCLVLAIPRAREKIAHRLGLGPKERLDKPRRYQEWTMSTSRRYLALFGARRTGKTAYLASLYATSGDAGDGGPAYHVSASDDPDDPTHRYLGRLGRALKAGQWPDSSPFERLTELKIRFTSGELTRSLVLPDVGGELTIRDQQGQLELKKEILAHYQDYHGFLIFIPADLTDPGQAAESKWEVDVLLNVLQERVAEGRTKIARPFALLVTKWDLIEPGPVTEASEARRRGLPGIGPPRADVRPADPLREPPHFPGLGHRPPGRRPASDTAPADQPRRADHLACRDRRASHARADPRLRRAKSFQALSPRPWRR